jgi:hypothetical protein
MNNLLVEDEKSGLIKRIKSERPSDQYSRELFESVMIDTKKLGMANREQNKNLNVILNIESIPYPERPLQSNGGINKNQSRIKTAASGFQGRSQVKFFHPEKLNRDNVLLKTILRPKTTMRYKSTKRIYFKRRPEMLEKNIIIMNCQGVIGDYFKPNLWNSDPPALYFRPSINFIYSLKIGLREGIRQLYSQFELVLLSGYKTRRTRHIKAILDKESIKFDAVYENLGESQKKITYDQIINDFKLKTSNAILKKILVKQDWFIIFLDCWFTFKF